MPPQQLNLKDIHLPDTGFAWWPPALGWWLLAVLILSLLFFAVWLYKRMTRKTALKTAKNLLQNLKVNTDLDEKEKLQQLSELLRRVVMSLSNREGTASLTGSVWLEYLDSSVTGNPFGQGTGQLLANAHYKKEPVTADEILSIISICEDWLNVQKENKK